MTVNMIFVLVVTFIRIEDFAARETFEMFQMVFVPQCCDIWPSQCVIALDADKVKLFEVVVFTERYLNRLTLCIDNLLWEEFGRALLTALITSEAINMVSTSQSTNKLAVDDLPAFIADLALLLRECSFWARRLLLHKLRTRLQWM